MLHGGSGVRRNLATILLISCWASFLAFLLRSQAFQTFCRELLRLGHKSV